MALVQLVDSISATPTLRLDLNLAPWRTLAGTDFGFPEMRRAASSSFLSDGEQISASAYGNRMLNLRLQVETATVDETATQLQKLIRELDRPTNYLRTQLGTVPVFFRTYRSTPEAWRIITTGTTIHVDVPIVADSYALGLEEALGTITVTNNPASGANPIYFDVAAASAKGDAVTPLYIRTTDSLANTTVIIGTRRRGTPASGVYFVQAEDGTNGTDTADQADANASGGNEVRTTFATVTGYTDRITTTLPSATASAELRGTYRVFVRHQKSATGSVMKGRLRVIGGIFNQEVTIPDSTTYQLVDYGLLQIPFGVQGTRDGYGVELGAGGVQVSLQFTRTSGTGSLDTDYILLVPADADLAMVTWPSTPAGPAWVFDGPNDEMYWRDTAGVTHAVSASGGTFPTYVGGLPQIAPNQNTRVFFAVVDGTISSTKALTVSYFPRWIGPVRPI